MYNDYNKNKMVTYCIIEKKKLTTKFMFKY